MTTKETRRESYDKIKHTTSQRKTLILEVLETGPKTAHEILQRLIKDGYAKDYDRNFVSPRLTELKEMDLVEVIGKKYEARTDRKVALWRLKEVQWSKHKKFNKEV